jgi:uncharacterized protein (DUF1015 family)
MVSDERASGSYVAQPLHLAPFSAVMLAPTRVGDPASLRAFARPYRDVSARLSQWIKQGAAHEDERPAVYVHEYTSGGITVRGIVAALDFRRRTDQLSDRALWPHEAIHPDQATELADRMHEMSLNPAPILLAHEGDPATRAWLTAAVAREPDRTFTDRAHQFHRLWAVHSPAAIEDLNHAMSGVNCLIADGHHRYAAYLDLEHRFPNGAWALGLTMLIDQTESPLHLGAIHRLIDRTTLKDLEVLAAGVGARTQRVDRQTALSRLAPDTVLATDGRHWLVVTPSLPAAPTLVEWLHQDFLMAGPTEPSITYFHDLEGLLAAAGPRRTAIVLPSPNFDAVMNSVRQGHVLPEKATSFQPKPSVGVLMRRVHDAPPDPS